METQELIEERDKLKSHATQVVLERENSAWRQALGLYTEGTIHPDDPILSAADIQRETGWGDVGYVSLPSDRARGAYWPFFRTEQELAHIRAVGRKIAVADSMGQSVVNNITNYTDGTGFNYKLEAKNKADTGSAEAIAQAQAALTRFVTANKLPGNKERALIEEALPVGEALICLKPSDDNIPRVRIRSTDHLREPPDAHKVEEYYNLPNGLDWSFGVAAPMDDAEDVKGYFCWWYGAGDNWEFVPESRAVHVKLGVPCDVKRGLSRFYSTYREIKQVAAGIFACAEGAKIQAHIAGIEKIPQGLPQAVVEDATASLGAFLAQVGKRRGARSIRLNPSTSATIITTDHDWQAGMMGEPQGPTLVQVFQAVARRVAAAYSMPEWMLTSDASNNNQASSITAGSGFDVAMQASQGFWCGTWAEVCWKAMAMMGFDVTYLKAVADLNVKGSQVASREEETDEKIRVMRKEAGILSDRTYSTEVGLDYDTEQANIAAQPKPAPPIIAAAGADGAFANQQANAITPAQTQPTYEQLVFSTLDNLAAKTILPVGSDIKRMVKQVVEQTTNALRPITEPFDIEVERDPETGMATKLIRVTREGAELTEQESPDAEWDFEPERDAEGKIVRLNRVPKAAPAGGSI